ncbi:MAG: ribonuclease HII [Candidatus Cloacimonadota bacterium]|nr:MAG: ribonuclease HII [Candidatus Cloacimonadota bacterium]
MIEYEIGMRQKFLFKKYALIGGIDEVGRGPLAGPVVAAMVIFDKNTKIEGLKDSKKLSAKKRAFLKPEIIEKAVAYEVCFIDEMTIDQRNILQASILAMKTCVEKCKVTPNYMLVDAVDLSSTGIECEAIIKGDSKEPTIMAASILAKEFRDDYMKKLALEFPSYGLEKHMGYGTKQHMEALSEHGVLDCHRRSFRPVMKTIVSHEESLKKEISYLSREGVIQFMARLKKMDLMVELGERVSIVNDVLRSF